MNNIREAVSHQNKEKEEEERKREKAAKRGHLEGGLTDEADILV